MQETENAKHSNKAYGESQVDRIGNLLADILFTALYSQAFDDFSGQAALLSDAGSVAGGDVIPGSQPRPAYREN